MMLAEWYIRRCLRQNPPTELGSVSDAETLRAIATVEQVIVPSATLLYAGKPIVRQFFAVQDQTLATKNRVLQLAASLAKGSEIDVLQAVVRAASEAGQREREMETDQLCEIGVIGKLDRTWYILGDETCMQQEQIELGVTIQTLAQQFEIDGKYTLFLAQKTPKRLLGIFACEYELNHKTVEALSLLQREGTEVVLLTSTKTRIARGVADKAGVTLMHSELDTDDKKRIVNALCKQQPRTIVLCDSSTLYGPRVHCVMVGSSGEIVRFPALLTYCRRILHTTRRLFFWSSY